ncbi:MAG: hypothetical protein U0441_13800 [Polyangiaceae bacterium]
MARSFSAARRAPSSFARASAFVAARTAASSVASSGAVGSASGSGAFGSARARTSTRIHTGALGVIATAPAVTRIGASTITPSSPSRAISACTPPMSRRSGP